MFLSKRQDITFGRNKRDNQLEGFGAPNNCQHFSSKSTLQELWVIIFPPRRDFDKLFSFWNVHHIWLIYYLRQLRTLILATLEVFPKSFQQPWQQDQGVRMYRFGGLWKCVSHGSCRWSSQLMHEGTSPSPNDTQPRDGKTLQVRGNKEDGLDPKSS